MNFLPNPCLLGILLSISTHNGPQLVFHYPPKPKDFGYKATPFVLDNDLLDSDDYSTDDESDTSSEPSERGDNSREDWLQDKNYVSGQTLLDLLDEQDRKRAERESRRVMKSSKKNSISSNPRTNSEINSLRSNEHHHHKQKENKVFGFDVEFLSEIVTPPRQLCNSRFEFTVDDMAFLGLPIHVNEEGRWRTHASKTGKQSRHSSMSKEEQVEEELEEPKQEESENTMSMFHVVFVMNPPVVEYHYRIEEMFHYVVSRLALVLRYEQAKSNYVWSESQKILKIKEQLEELPLYDLYANILQESSLAQTIVQCFNSISTSNIANLQVQDKMISLQIPLRNQFKSLMPKTTPVIPGSYLSSTIIDENSSEDEEQNIGFMALLLLDEPDSIITELKAEPGSPLAKFIKSIHPTISLNKLAQRNNMDPLQLASFAKHLIYWRRARALVPLHLKSVFIVSPMAPLDNIRDRLKSFKQEFPPLPSLPSFLSLLSNTKPRPFVTIIPSRDHRDIYMDALAWLIRYGYVTQLLTFVWIKIPNRVKISVEEDLEREGLTKKSKDSKFKMADISTDATGKDKNGQRSHSSSSSQLKHFWNGQEVIIEEEEEEDTILLEPERATAVERRWIGKVIKGQPQELVVLFHKLVKYFNGKTPLEVMMVKENVSRHDVRRLLHGINDYVISVKHW
jgi:hypothetical protein